MNCILTRHFRLTRFFLLAVGLWPYQQSRTVRLKRILLFSILTSFIVFQFITIATTERSLGYIMKILSSASFFSIFLIKYNSFWINIQSVKYLLEQFQHMHNELKDENEISIIEKYGRAAQRYTVKLVLFGICCLFIVIPVTLWQYIFRNSLLLKEYHTIYMQTEHFVDQEKYSSLILLHMTIAAGIGTTVMIGMGTMLIACFKFACGMFKIASYRIEQVMEINRLKNITLKSEFIIYNNMIYAVDIHRRALKFSEFLISSFEGTFFCLIVISVACLSLNLFQIFQFSSFADHIEKLALHFTMVIVCILYMFLANYVGQEITDHCNGVFFSVYNIRWYTLPLHIQKLVLFILQRGSKSFGLCVGGLFVASLECFATLASASLSYFTVMYSMQK